jgi:cell division protein FtsI (penicillin-binding protein 3)/stage V sporulation protein D (sporulation-specific penicillin-binding protein)
MTAATTHGRLRIIFGGIALIGVIFFGRLSIQITHGADYRDDAEKQYVASVPDIYNRGSIYFEGKDGEKVSAATLETGYVLAINPKLIINKDDAFRVLSGAIALDRDDFMAKASKKNDPYEEVARRVPEEVKDKIMALEIPGVQTFRERWRVYPSGSLASQVIGMVGYQDGTLSGRYGIERAYNDTLSRNGEGLYVNFFADMFLNLSTTLATDEPKTKEGDVVLTIEPKVQAELEALLKETQKKWHAESAGGIVMDPRDGKILAMGALPDFDPNHIKDIDSVKVLANPLVEGVYEMGSTIKPLTIAAGLDAGAITPHTTYNDLGVMTLDKKTFSNFDGKGRGPNTPVQEILSQSLNTGVAWVTQRMGNGTLRQYFREKYHLGDETGIDLPNEVAGLMDNLESRRDIEYATASFGQGIAMSPINVVTALASLGNGGKLVNPYVVSRIEYTDGGERVTVPNPPQEILKPQTSDDITRMLVTVVDKALRGGTAKMEDYSIAAKTGTAQMARPHELGGGYYDDRYMHTFFGYYPAYDPQFIVFMYLTYPKEVKYASETLTTPFMTLAKFLLQYYNIPPDRGPNVVTLSHR